MAPDLRTELLWLFSSIILGACGQVLLKAGVNRLGAINLDGTAFLPTMLRVFTNPWVVVGILFFVTSMILWLKVISNMQLSQAYPSVSLSYLIVFGLSILIFKESVSAEQVMGLAFISLGVYFLHI